MKEDTQSVYQVSAPLTSESGFPESPPWTLKRPPVGQYKVSEVNRTDCEKRRKNAQPFAFVHLLCSRIFPSFWIVQYFIPSFQVFPHTSFWTPLGSHLLLWLTGSSSWQSRVTWSKRCQSVTSPAASHSASGTSQSSFPLMRPSSCEWRDTTGTVSCSRESPVFLSQALYLVSDVTHIQICGVI